MLPSNLTGESPVHEPERPHHHTHERIEPRTDKEPRVIGPSYSVEHQLSCLGEEFGRVRRRGGGGGGGCGVEEKDECEGKVDQAEWRTKKEGSETATDVVDSPCAIKNGEIDNNNYYVNY